MVIKNAVQLYFQLEKSNKRYRYLHRFAKNQQQQNQQQQQQKTNKQTQKPEWLKSSSSIFEIDKQ